MRVGLFVTCLVDLIRPSVGFAAVKLLEEAGCSVEVPLKLKELFLVNWPLSRFRLHTPCAPGSETISVFASCSQRPKGVAYCQGGWKGFADVRPVRFGCSSGHRIKEEPPRTALKTALPAERFVSKFWRAPPIRKWSRSC